MDQSLKNRISERAYEILGRTWPSGRSSRSALAGGGAGSAGGIDGGARPKIRAAKEEVRCATQEAASTGTS